MTFHNRRKPFLINYLSIKLKDGNRTDFVTNNNVQYE